MSDKKSIAKSIRLTEELFSFINGYAGNGFNDKFHNVITYCFKNEPKIKQRIHQAEQELIRLNREIEKKRELLMILRQLESAVDRATIIAEKLD